MGESRLELPYLAVLPLCILSDEELQPAAKIHYGCFVGLSKKEGYCWATDEQFAQMHGVSVSTIEKWNRTLSEKGYIQRETHNDPYRDKTGRLLWKRRRRIYTRAEISGKEVESLKNDASFKEGGNDPSQNQEFVDSSKKEGCKREISKGKISKEKRGRCLSSEPMSFYGSDELFKMTSTQHDKLQKEVGAEQLAELIEELNNYIGSTGVKYKSHYHTLKSWYNRKKKDALSGKAIRPTQLNHSNESKPGSIVPKNIKRYAGGA